MAEMIDVRQLPVADSVTVEAVKGACRIGKPVAPIAMAGAGIRAVEPAVSAAIKPGKERWPVKTGTDDDIAKVKKTVVPATVEELRSIPRPSSMADPALVFPAFQRKRAGTTETTIWRVDCNITVIKLEQDGDYHLVLQGPSGDTIIAEIPTPDPPFVVADSPFLDGIRRSRAAIDKKFGKTIAATQFLPMIKPENRNEVTNVPMAAFSALPAGTRPLSFSATAGGQFKMSVKPTKVRLTGVGFFDRKHDQTGVAPNGIELHPVLDVKFL